MSAGEGNAQVFSGGNEKALWLLLIIAVAIVLRFRGLAFQSYGFEELLSARCSNPANSFAHVLNLSLTSYLLPLQQLGMWFSYQALGYNDWAGRLPSALAGVLTVPVIYLLGRDLFDSQTGLYAAALVTPNYYLLYYAQDARSYALLCFLACLSCLFLVRILRSAAWFNPLLYAIAMTALLFTHRFALPVFAIQVCLFLLYWIFYGWSDRWLLVRAGVALLLVAAAMVPLVPVIVEHAPISEVMLKQPSALVGVRLFISYFNSAWLALCMAVLVLVALLAAVYRGFRATKSSWPVFSVIALFLWIVLGFLLPWLGGLFAQPVLTDPNTIILVPPIIILAAFGLRSIPTSLLQGMACLALLGLSFYHLLVGIHYYSAVQKNQYREVTAAITAYDPALPVYALLHNEARYNTYFEQQNSPLRATDYQRLIEKLDAGTAEPLLWLVGGHSLLDAKNIAERYGLLQVANYLFVGAFAELLLDPRTATPVAMEKSVLSGKRENWLSAKPFTWRDDSVQLLIAVNSDARVEPRRKVQVDLLDIRGHILETHSAELGAVPSTMQISPQLRAGKVVRLVVRMPAGEAQPGVWVLNFASFAR
jgi:mannosyltransferase